MDEDKPVGHKLTNRQKLFIEYYLQFWNASEAARSAGYKSKANVVGARLLAIDSIQDAIRARMIETTMQTDEVLHRLTDQARLNLTEFIVEKTRVIYDRDGNKIGEMQVFEVDWENVKKRGHLIKSIANTPSGPKLEVYDSQSALIQIGKALGVLTDRVDMTSKGDQVSVVMYMPSNGRDDRSADDQSTDDTE